ncbi:Transcription factor GTE7 [Acorus calamus]|uniref:Transcription factor GTE7 n=1 Tax=Acorus calamus TaxID=4465 RepID=A0AAV9FBP1_ACOCL|nr:Transcription factor GTE7 [Acorus calamus]
MASAVLSGRNEPCWSERKIYDRRSPNRNPNPNPNSRFDRRTYEKPAAVVDAVASSDTGSFITFNIASYNPEERKDLKRRFEAELEQVRAVKARVESIISRSAVAPVSPVILARSDGPKTIGGLKRPVSSPPVPRPPKRPASAAAAVEAKAIAAVMKKCGQLLTTLLKRKKAWIFKDPVDAVRMGLHDYHRIIKQPMDLGTVKSRIERGHYAGPLDFASDVRLTFNNALMYNPVGHEVHVVAGRLLKQFETMFNPAYDLYLRRVSKSRSKPMPPPPPRKAVALKPKREMSFNEKQRLSVGLRGLPAEKLEQVVQMVRQKNLAVSQNGDEFEIDILAIDSETLWELDRLVKSAGGGAHKLVVSEVPPFEEDNEKSPMRRNEEEVDVGEEELPDVATPVVIEKDVAGESSSSGGSSSDASSSSDSDSGSSSDSDSDPDKQS